MIAKKVQDITAIFFVVAVGILSAVSILGIWEFFGRDVISKSFSTISLLAFITIIVMIAGRFIESKTQNQEISLVPNPIFGSIRRVNLVVLIISVSLLAVLGVLSIWDVIQDRETLYKALSSIGVLAFSTFVAVITCLEREGVNSSDGKNKPVNIGGLIIVFIFILFVLSIFGGLFH